MTDPSHIIVGAVGSPYSRKLRAVMNYRRIPYVWVNQGSAESRSLPKPPVQLLPQLIATGADGAATARIDSTPLIRELERERTESDLCARPLEQDPGAWRTVRQRQQVGLDRLATAGCFVGRRRRVRRLGRLGRTAEHARTCERERERAKT